MGISRPCWFYSDQDAGKPPELCLWTGQHNSGSGAPRPAGRAQLGRAGRGGPAAPPLRDRRPRLLPRGGGAAPPADPQALRRHGAFARAILAL